MGRKIKDRKGDKIGFLVAERIAGKNQKGKLMWECYCRACGSKCVKSGAQLSQNTLVSCGCLTGALTSSEKFKHGLAGKHEPLYHTWAAMKDKCYNPNYLNYKCYGGAGIRVCDEWLNDPEAFYNWAVEQEGPYLLRYSILKDFSPDNCYMGWERMLITLNKIYKASWEERRDNEEARLERKTTRI